MESKISYLELKVEEYKRNASKSTKKRRHRRKRPVRHLVYTSSLSEEKFIDPNIDERLYFPFKDKPWSSYLSDTSKLSLLGSFFSSFSLPHLVYRILLLFCLCSSSIPFLKPCICMIYRRLFK